MKVNIKEASNFRPVDVTISFETEDEFKIFTKLMGTNHSVPNYMKENQIISTMEYELLRELMNKIWSDITSYKYNKI